LASINSKSADWRFPIYSASKSYQDFISQTLANENQELDVMTVYNLPIAGEETLEGGVKADELVNGVFADLGH